MLTKNTGVHRPSFQPGGGILVQRGVGVGFLAASQLISRPIFLRIHNTIVNNNSPKAADPSIPGSSSPSLLLICALICEGLELKISSIGQKPLYGPQIESDSEKKFHRQEFQMDFFMLSHF